MSFNDFPFKCVIFNILLCTIVKHTIVELSRIDGDLTESQNDIDVDFKPEPIHGLVSGNNELAGGLVSIDCLRCLCLRLSDCRAIGCVIRNGLKGCGYFWLTHAYWIDCGKLGHNYTSCGNDLYCASECIQKYMQRYAKDSHCPLNCEGFARELGGGPNGCNDPRTLHFWNTVQQQPGCKGVE